MEMLRRARRSAWLAASVCERVGQLPHVHRGMLAIIEGIVHHDAKAVEQVVVDLPRHLWVPPEMIEAPRALESPK